jgi:TolB-like protein
LSGFFINPCISKEAQKVAVLPFTMNTKDDLTFLQKGIFDMFSSRISYGDEVIVLTRENLENILKKSDPSFSVIQSVNEAKAKELGAFLKVDYVLFGSLTLFGNSMSLDVNMIDIKNSNPALTFFRQGTEAGKVIPELDKIAEEINFKVFGRQAEEFQGAQLAQAQNQGGAKENYASPLNKYESIFEINQVIEGMAVGDVDGDKKNEVVIVYGHTIEILEVSSARKLVPGVKIEISPALVIVGIDVADMNHNGYAEMFVSCINSMNQDVKAIIYEYNGNKYKEGSETYPWYFRVVDQKGQKILFAQKSGKGGPYTSQQVFKVQVEGSKYGEGEKLKTPSDFSIMGFTSGKIFKDNIEDRVYTGKDGSLKVFDESGKVEWSSEKGYGGSLLFFRFIKEKQSDEEYEGEYFQPRNLIYDMKGLGKSNLIAIKNNNQTNEMFKGLKQYSYGLIEIMEWNELGLSPVSAPKKIPGQITDISISDVYNNSKEKLLISFIKQRKQILSGGTKSLIIAYDL